MAAGLGGVILAWDGADCRGEYAAITAWFGARSWSAVGQPAALFYVARSGRAREYVATSRAMTLTTGAVALAAGLLAPASPMGIRR